MLKANLSLILLALSLCVLGQEPQKQLISTAGNQVETRDYSISWSIGEILTETILSQDLELAQGFHQCSFIVTAVEKIAPSQPEIKIYPNPVTDFFYIKLNPETLRDGTVQVALLNMQGQTLLNEEISSDNHQINLQGLSNSMYLLRITFVGGMTCSFKIIKQ